MNKKPEQMPLSFETVECDRFETQFIRIVQAGNLNDIPALLDQLSGYQLDKHYPEIAAVIGFLMLEKYPDWEQNLPQDSVFIAHYHIVHSAFQAYQDNNLKKLNEKLKLIPFRSAFKHFRVVLNAALLISSPTEKMYSSLGSIPNKSPYFSIARLLLALTKNGAELIKDLDFFNYPQRYAIEQLKGFNEQQLEFITHLLRQYEDLSDKTMFSMAIQYQDLFGHKLAEHFCQTLLANYSAGYREYSKHFGSVNEFEENRIKALCCERDDNFYDAGYYWRLCLGQINKEEGGDLKSALILRHMAYQQQKTDIQIDCLTESLQYDPDDRDCLLTVLHYYADGQQQTEAYDHWLRQGMERFPQDVDLLVLAIQTASKNKDINQAGEFSQRLLQIDPMNNLAKQTLFSANLHHTKQLIAEKKYEQAEQQLAEIEHLKLAKNHKDQVEIIRGFLTFVEGNKTDGLQVITNALQVMFSDPVNRQFKTSMEAFILAVSIEDISSIIFPADEHLLSSQELIQLNQQLEFYVGEEAYQAYLKMALEQIQPALLNSLQQQACDETLWLNLSQQLFSIKYYELLNKVTILAFDRWQKPVWVYYQVCSETEDQAEQCSFINLRRLQNSLVQAKEKKDQRSILLIDDYLNRYRLTHPGKITRFFQSLFTEGEEKSKADPMEQLFGTLPDEILMQLSEPIESISKQTTPELLAEELTVADDHDKHELLLAMMQDPDLYNALIVVKAAEQAEVDINVNCDEVLKCFSVFLKR